jgi:protein required for attachment to host cells
MSGIRVLVAGKSQAQLYELGSRRGILKALQSFVNPAAHQPERALGSARPGRVTNPRGGVRHSYQQEVGLKEKAEESFVRYISSALAADARAADGAPIILVAAPRLLGRFRRHLPAAVRARIASEIRHDLVKLPAAELNKRVRAALLELPASLMAPRRAPRGRLAR